MVSMQILPILNRKTTRTAAWIYAEKCWAPSSAFAQPTCNCFGESAHPMLGARRPIAVIIADWYVHRPAYVWGPSGFVSWKRAGATPDEVRCG